MKPPYFIEFHASYGHAIRGFAASYPWRGYSAGLDLPGASYGQRLLLCLESRPVPGLAATGRPFPLLPYRYEDEL